MDREFYERYAELQDRHWWFAGRRRIITAEVRRALAALDPPCDSTCELLDVGCGTGAMLGALSRLGHIQGVDTDDGAVELCHARGFADVQRIAGPPLPFAEASFDLITALDVLEHIDDDVAMVTEVRRLLRPGGRLVATVPALPALWGRQDTISHHKRRYVTSTLSRAVERGGLRIERLTYFNTVLFPPIAAVRLLRRLRPEHGEVVSDFEMNRDGAINGLLARVFGAEARWLRRRDLPFGVSLLVVATRPPVSP